MARFYREYQESMERNPLSQVYDSLCQAIRQELKTYGAESLLDGVMSISQYAGYLLFEAVAQRLRETSKEDASSIHSYLSQLPEDDPMVFDGIVSVAKQVSNDFALRKDFLLAEISRLHLPIDSETVLEYQKMRERSALHGGYRLTPVQLEQLHDRASLWIQKKHRFRQFRSSKHTTNEDITQFYDLLIQHAQACKRETDIAKRIIRAINLNDFENKNICMFLYRVAEYCAEQGISAKELDEEQITLLSYITGVISCDRAMVTHKPVVIMKHYIEPAIQGDWDEINRLVNLEFLGLHFRLEYLPGLLDRTRYTNEDINRFFLSPPDPLYDIFAMYSPEIQWDPRGRIASNLRVLIDLLTVDPLSK